MSKEKIYKYTGLEIINQDCSLIKVEAHFDMQIRKWKVTIKPRDRGKQ